MAKMILRRPSIVAISLGLALTAGCATGGGSVAGDGLTDPGATSGGGAETASSDGTSSAARTLATVATGQGGEHVTTMRWTEAGDLCVGYDDGKVATLRDKSHEAELVALSKGGVSAIDPTGTYAIVVAKVPEYVNLSGRILVRFADLPDVASVDFSVSGKSLVIAEKSGQIHVWRTKIVQDESSNEKLGTFLRRQQPEFTGHFPDVQGPIRIMDNNSVIFGQSDGRVIQWLTDRGETLTIMKLDSPVVSIAAEGEYVLATSEGGQFGAGSTNQLGFLKWSRELRASHVERSPEPGQILLVSDGKLSLRHLDSGAVTWEVPMANASICGMAVSAVGKRAAICLGDTVALVDTTNGALLSTFHRAGDGFTWSPRAE